jgi:hypothetical protein
LGRINQLTQPQEASMILKWKKLSALKLSSKNLEKARKNYLKADILHQCLKRDQYFIIYKS